MNHPHTQDHEAGNSIKRILGDLLTEDMTRFGEELEAALHPQAEYLTHIERELHERGKKIRPIVMLLAARMIHGPNPLPAKAIKGAVSLEMLHVATLIHDDIVDDALFRRGLPSVSAARGTKQALLIGDLQFVQALRGFVDTVDVQEDLVLAKLVLDTAFDICRGELDEFDVTFNGDEDTMRDRYLTTIDRKTAVLFGLACEAGVTLAGGRTHQARRAGFYGRCLGRAFQIMDDIFDILQSQEHAGKTPGMDLIQQRWSLPLIYAVGELGPQHPVSRAMLDGQAPHGADLKRCLSDLKQSSALDRAYSDARSAALEALSYLEPFPASSYRTALEELTMFVVDRPIETRPQPHVSFNPKRPSQQRFKTCQTISKTLFSTPYSPISTTPPTHSGSPVNSNI